MWIEFRHPTRRGRIGVDSPSQAGQSVIVQDELQVRGGALELRGYIDGVGELLAFCPE